MAECLHGADPLRAFGASEKQSSDICVSVTPRYGVLRFGPWFPMKHLTTGCSQRDSHRLCSSG